MAGEGRRLQAHPAGIALHDPRGALVRQGPVRHLPAQGYRPKHRPGADLRRGQPRLQGLEPGADARQARTLYVSGTAVVVALGAAGIVIASGSSLAWAVVAAIVGALVAGGIVHLLSTASNEGEQIDRERKAVVGALVLSVRSPTAEKRREAVSILRASGGTGVEIE